MKANYTAIGYWQTALTTELTSSNVLAATAVTLVLGGVTVSVTQSDTGSGPSGSDVSEPYSTG